ncbi:MAG: peptidoglycan-binding protein, partial [Patescibacteria group bacterium]
PTNSATVIGSSVTLTATAADNILLGGVTFKVDNATIGSEFTSSPFTTTWDSSSVSNGTHTISAVARDSYNNLATSSVSVTVSNDTTPPVLSAGAPSGAQPSGTTQTTLQVTTNKAATCKYSTSAGQSYASMANTFNNTGGTTHYSTLTGLVDGTSYTYYVRCRTTAANPNLSDYTVSFSVPIDTIAPVISGVNVTNVTQSAATVGWATDEGATSYVEYGTSLSYSQNTTLSSSLITLHSQTLSGLSTATLYYYRITSKDARDNTRQTTGTFTTAAASLVAEDIYIAQNAAGADSGASCAAAHSVTWFNTSSNWGSGAGKIGPGDTAHLCGTVTGSLIFQGSGVAGNPITLKFEDNAKMTAPVWGFVSWLRAAIYINGGQYIIIDGGTNGTVESTGNGTGLAYQESQNLILLYGCENCEVKNVYMKDAYIRTAGSADPYSANAISATGNNIKIHDNRIENCGNCVSITFPGGGYSNGLEIYNNSISKMSVGINMGPGGGDGWMDNTYIHDNDIFDAYPWTGNWGNDTSQHNHNNGMHIFANSTGSKMSNLYIYNNYIHGNWGDAGNATAFMFIELNPNSTNVALYNNLLVLNDAGTPANAFLTAGGTGVRVTNNTIIGNGGGFCMFASPGAYLYNNICSQIAWGIYVSNYDFVGTNVADFVQTMIKGSLADSDYNVYYLTNASDFSMGNPLMGTSLANWQALTGFDTHSLFINPQLASNYVPNAGSPVIGKAINFSSYYAADFDGTARPSTGPWDVGAHQFSSNAISDSQAPTVPDNFRATVVSGSTVSFAWTASTDNYAVSGYRLYRNNSLVNSTTGTTITDSGLSALTSYTYTLSAYDASSNESARTSDVSTTTLSESSNPPDPDITSPNITFVTSTSITKTSSRITWSTNEAAYSQVEYGLTTAYGSKTASTSLTTSPAIDLSSLLEGTVYHYRVWSADVAGNTSISDEGFFTTVTDTVIPTTPPSTPAIVPSVTSGGGGGGYVPSGTPSGWTGTGVRNVAPPNVIGTGPITIGAPKAGGAGGVTITRVLSLGSTGADVKLLQQYLNQNGYKIATTGTGSPGKESTYFGQTTQAALQKYQCAKKLVCTGTPGTTGYGATGPKTRATLKGSAAITPLPVAPTSFTRTLQVGSTGADVKALQQYLNTHGYKIAVTGTGSPGKESTYFGPATKAALVKFQAANKITPTSGVFGALTRAKIKTIR